MDLLKNLNSKFNKLDKRFRHLMNDVENERSSSQCVPGKELLKDEKVDLKVPELIKVQEEGEVVIYIP